MSDPDWVLQLRELYKNAGSPSHRSLGRVSGVSRTTVDNVLSAKANASRLVVSRIVAALSTDEATQTRILGLYDIENQGKRQRAVVSKYKTNPSADAQLIAAAINNLADAIRGLQPPTE